MKFRYILNGRAPVPCDDLLDWYEWMDKADRRVATTERDGITVSTVFIGLDHQLFAGPPLLFETMVFGLPGRREICERYATWDEAVEGHKVICKQAFGESAA